MPAYFPDYHLLESSVDDNTQYVNVGGSASSCVVAKYSRTEAQDWSLTASKDVQYKVHTQSFAFT